MSRPTANSVREQPAYSIGEVADYLRMNAMTLQSWALGRDYATSSGTKRWQPLFKIADTKRRRLSFVNLVEASVLSALRRERGLAMPNIRDALTYVSRTLGVTRPLADQSFETDGVDLFVERYGELVNASRHGQLAIRELLQEALQRIEREGPDHVPIRLYPPKADSHGRSNYVVFDPEMAFGRPSLVHSGVPIAVIADRFQAGDSIAVLAHDYNVEQEAIEEAVRQAGRLKAA